MRKFTKIMLGIAGGMACVGAICMLIAFAMGLTTDGFVQMVRDGKFAFKISDGLILRDVDIETKEEVQEIKKGDSDIYLDKAIKMGQGIEVMVLSDGNVYRAIEVPTSMKINFGAGKMEIVYDDVEKIEIHEKNIGELELKVVNGILKIENSVHITVDEVDDRSLTIVIPKDMKFDEIDLEIGAAEADIDGLLADDISITIGAGLANVSNITAEHMEMEVGAGEANVSNLSVTELDVECGMGLVTVDLNGTQSDYNYNVECGMGNVVVGNYSYGGLGAEHHGENHHANKKIDVECGMGEVQIQFNE